MVMQKNVLVNNFLKFQFSMPGNKNIFHWKKIAYSIQRFIISRNFLAAINETSLLTVFWISNIKSRRHSSFLTLATKRKGMNALLSSLGFLRILFWRFQKRMKLNYFFSLLRIKKWNFAILLIMTFWFMTTKKSRYLSVLIKWFVCTDVRLCLSLTLFFEYHIFIAWGTVVKF